MSILSSDDHGRIIGMNVFVRGAGWGVITAIREPGMALIRENAERQFQVELGEGEYAKSANQQTYGAVWVRASAIVLIGKQTDERTAVQRTIDELRSTGQLIGRSITNAAGRELTVTGFSAGAAHVTTLQVTDEPGSYDPHYWHIQTTTVAEIGELTYTEDTAMHTNLTLPTTVTEQTFGALQGRNNTVAGAIVEAGRYYRNGLHVELLYSHNTVVGGIVRTHYKALVGTSAADAVMVNAEQLEDEFTGSSAEDNVFDAALYAAFRIASNPIDLLAIKNWRGAGGPGVDFIAYGRRPDLGEWAAEVRTSDGDGDTHPTPSRDEVYVVATDEEIRSYLDTKQYRSEHEAAITALIDDRYSVVEGLLERMSYDDLELLKEATSTLIPMLDVELASRDSGTEEPTASSTDETLVLLRVRDAIQPFDETTDYTRTIVKLSEITSEYILQFVRSAGYNEYVDEDTGNYEPRELYYSRALNNIGDAAMTHIVLDQHTHENIYVYQRPYVYGETF